MQVKPTADDRPIRSMADERLDCDRPAPLRKSYIVASSYRSGSTYLCSLLWQTGRLGAPSEVLNPRSESLVLMNRFKTTSPADYITKLLAHRTSRNGIFGMKAHFHHFEAFLQEYPGLLAVLSPLSYIYIDRQDKLAQAVSMAKALQTNRWVSRREEEPNQSLTYDPGLITNCIHEVESQDALWLRWFEANGIAPYRVTYEGLTADTVGTVRGIVGLMEAQDDEPGEVHVPSAMRQSDETNQDWIARYRHDTASGTVRGDGMPAGTGAAQPGSATPVGGGHFFDRYDRLIQTLPEAQNSATGFVGLKRLRRRYDAIIGHNSALFRDARVLDLMSAQGFWTLAALDAGASHVLGLEASARIVETADSTFAELGVQAGSYEFKNAKILSALKAARPGQFDVVLCKGFFEHCNFTEFFHCLSLLRPKHVILDTKISPGEGAFARFAIAGKSWKGRSGKIMSTPSHALIALLCESEFRWRPVDWQAMGITDWTGIPDYARDSHRTYVLDRL